MKRLSQFALLMAGIIFQSNQSLACTDFRLTAKDGTLLVTRSMEFGVDVQSSFKTSPQNRQYSNTAPDGKPGLSWQAKYGYVYLTGFGQNMALDGMNEKGLTFEYLYLPGETQYNSVPDGKSSQAIPHTLFGDWVLSNFQSIDEVRQALANVYVFAQAIPNFGILQAHAAIYDATGKGIVVEFVNGKTRIYDNIGVMTNSPTYKWQVTNLRNYLNLTPYNPKPIVANDITYSVTGQGAGMVGLPGDVSPPSRFVKTSFMLNYVYPANNAAEILNLAEHIINNVDIPKGIARSVVNDKEFSDTTQWVVFKDITHKTIYYRTYDNLSLRSISLDKLNFSKNAPVSQMSLNSPVKIQDVSAQFLKSK